MFMPKRVKYRKQMRGRMTGRAHRGSTLAYGEYGLTALECGWVTDRQIEAARIAMTRYIKRGGNVWIRISLTNLLRQSRQRLVWEAEKVLLNTGLLW